MFFNLATLFRKFGRTNLTNGFSSRRKRRMPCPLPTLEALEDRSLLSVSFQPAVTYAAGTTPTSMTTGDFNADGKMDLVVVNRNSNNVSILLGHGNGTFGAASNFAVGVQPHGVTVADFNADGKLDVATANEGSNSVSVLLGTGTGSFGAAANFSVGVNPHGVTAGDFNADGKLDLSTANEGSNNVSILLNNTVPPVIVTTLTVTASDATYTSSAYGSANLTTTVTPADASGSVSYAFYSDAGGTTSIATPINVGTYYVRAFFTSSAPASFTDAASDIVSFTITAKSLTVDASTQGTLNIAKAGTISFALRITDGLVANNDNVVALFNGAMFTIVVDGTSFSLAATATVALDGTINVSMKMSQALQNALLTALSQGTTVDFGLSAVSNDLNYSIDADATSRLINQGKLKFAVV